ncbi:hypothetical protein Ciccas_002271 [Cichlidogyrus casuarinus]|uniref:Nuclear export mediator factor NEMF n=1 Tax=Cichlidogyrus casuarinus TaxID=1844966 RepID=A0ABD2QHT0_9PLAT
MKQILSSFDIHILIQELKKEPTSEFKKVLYLESGQRLHLTDYEWPKNDAPSGFSMKLRKHLKKKHLTEIRQIGFDRVVDLRFGLGEYAHHIVVELYNRGNMILTDHEYRILHLLRPRTDQVTATRIATNEIYSFDNTRQLSSSFSEPSKLSTEIHSILERYVDDPSENLLKVLSNEFPIGNELLDHACKKFGLTKPYLISSSDMESRKNKAEDLAKEIIFLCTEFQTCGENQSVVIGKPCPGDQSKLDLYESFQPLLFEQFRSRAHICYASFNQAVDDFFTRIETLKSEQGICQKEKKALKKLQNIEKDHSTRIKQLVDEQENFTHVASLIETNRQLVDSIISLINRYIANQLDWQVIETLINEATLKGDPVACSIEKLHFDPFEDGSSSDTENDNDGSTNVLINLDCNAMVNASQYYNKRKIATQKIDRTVKATSKATKSAQRLADRQMNDIQMVRQITKAKKAAWFEKFNWFISSENYLVVAGRDAQQNEMLVKRYFGASDIYVHANVHGASTVIVKARKLDSCEKSSSSLEVAGSTLPRPPWKTLNEAAYMALAFSAAWSSSVTTDAWWVYQHQVSKTAPSGQYLGTGSFMIRGQKNFLQPSQLVYGFTIMFKLAPDSIERHKNDRRIKIDVNDATASEITTTIEEESDSESDGEQTDGIFPKVDLKLDLAEKKLVNSDKIRPVVKEEHSLIQTHGSKLNPVERSKGSEKQDPRKNEMKEKPDNKQSNQPIVLKRGQKAKLKKIKQKYRNQDEEERELRMQLLQGENAKPSRCHAVIEEEKPLNEPVHSEVEDEESEPEQSDASEPTPDLESQSDQKEKDEAVEEPKEESTDEEADVNPVTQNADDLLELLDSLTGQPNEDDEILYALPVSAPYSCMQNFKFKVKLTPGMKKRGKAAKQALSLFMVNKFATEREKALIRAIKDEECARNMLPNVKVHNPNPQTRLRKR